ncbi:hypothetical protein, partial [Ciceribacter ferrooxidans]|uniref:hypothetical protein n=1 Tax=Ciceribacter ferrooxidans TaxID=2509717 RepID=UPI00196B5851
GSFRLPGFGAAVITAALDGVFDVHGTISPLLARIHAQDYFVPRFLLMMGGDDELSQSHFYVKICSDQSSVISEPAAWIRLV